MGKVVARIGLSANGDEAAFAAGRCRLQPPVGEPSAGLDDRFEESMGIGRRFLDDLELGTGFDDHENALMGCGQIADPYRTRSGDAGRDANGDPGTESQGIEGRQGVCG